MISLQDLTYVRMNVSSSVLPSALADLPESGQLILVISLELGHVRQPPHAHGAETQCAQYVAKEGAEPSTPADLQLVLFLSSASCQPAEWGLLESHFSLCKEPTNHGAYLPSAEDEKV